MTTTHKKTNTQQQTGPSVLGPLSITFDGRPAVEVSPAIAANMESMGAARDMLNAEWRIVETLDELDSCIIGGYVRRYAIYRRPAGLYLAYQGEAAP